MEPIPFGYTWSHKVNKWSFSQKLATEEINSLMTPEQKTKETLFSIMNGIHHDLCFTVESQSEYADNHLPTLDFKISLVNSISNPKQFITYMYYKKPMNTNFTTIETSASCPEEKK